MRRSTRDDSASGYASIKASRNDASTASGSGSVGGVVPARRMPARTNVRIGLPFPSPLCPDPNGGCPARHRPSKRRSTVRPEEIDGTSRSLAIGGDPHERRRRDVVPARDMIPAGNDARPEMAEQAGNEKQSDEQPDEGIESDVGPKDPDQCCGHGANARKTSLCTSSASGTVRRVAERTSRHPTGTYSTTIPAHSIDCYSERLSGFGSRQLRIGIAPTDAGFSSCGCGTWTLIQ